MRPHRRSHDPLRRRRVLAGTLLTLALFAGVLALAEGLRHPDPGPHPSVERGADPGDPRLALDCPDPEPLEGRDRREATLAPPREPVAVTSAQLLDCPERYDRRTVVYQGEAIGAVLPRRDGAWVQVNDDVYAGPVGPLPSHREYRGANAGVGVLLPGELAGDVTVVGGPRTRGDLVEVVGVFRRVEPGSREVAVVRADSVEVLRRGEHHPDPPLRNRQVAAGILAALAAAMAVAERVVARRRLRR